MTLIEQVAEEKCSGCFDCSGQSIVKRLSIQENRARCQGTRLRWQKLSRKCPIDWPDQHPTPNPMGTSMSDFLGCWDCKGSGRIPDVTIGKVLDILLSIGIVEICPPNTDTTQFGCSVDDDDDDDDDDGYIYGDTPELAVCAALLASL